MNALIIGCGRILYKHLESIRKQKKNIKIIGVCDNNPKKLKILKKNINLNFLPIIRKL